VHPIFRLGGSPAGFLHGAVPPQVYFRTPASPTPRGELPHRTLANACREVEKTGLLNCPPLPRLSGTKFRDRSHRRIIANISLLKADAAGVRSGHSFTNGLADNPGPTRNAGTGARALTAKLSSRPRRFDGARIAVVCQSAKLRAQTDPHSPGPYRVNGVFANMPEFQKAYNCAPKTKMVRENACRVW